MGTYTSYTEYLKNLTLEEEINDNTESLETSEGDSVECISIENLIGILKRRNIINNE